MTKPSLLIDISDWSDEGGSCQVYPIKNHSNLVFKEFKNKNKAIEAYTYNKLLSKYDLAPKVYSKINKLCFDDQNFCESSNWGYISEYAITDRAKSGKISIFSIQKLVDNIFQKTGLKFWDCHWYNIGYVKRKSRKKLVCIDTGKESFDGLSNAWGNIDPGPKCTYCNKYKCSCKE